MDARDRFEVTAFVNTSDDHQFDGYKPVDPLALVGDFTVAAADIDAVPETFFAIGNRMGADADGQRWPSDVRSPSRGRPDQHPQPTDQGEPPPGSRLAWAGPTSSNPPTASSRWQAATPRHGSRDSHADCSATHVAVLIGGRRLKELPMTSTITRHPAGTPTSWTVSARRGVRSRSGSRQ
jgi:hypothetical protein